MVRCYWRNQGGAYGPKDLQAQGLSREPAMRTSVVVRCDAPGQEMAHARGPVRDGAWRHTQPVTSKQAAERVWEPKFVGEIMAGRDPRIPMTKPAPAGALTVTEFLDRYYTNYVEAEGLKSATTVHGHLK